MFSQQISLPDVNGDESPSRTCTNNADGNSVHIVINHWKKRVEKPKSIIVHKDYFHWIKIFFQILFLVIKSYCCLTHLCVVLWTFYFSSYGRGEKFQFVLTDLFVNKFILDFNSQKRTVLDVCDGSVTITSIVYTLSWFYFIFGKIQTLIKRSNVLNFRQLDFFLSLFLHFCRLVFRIRTLDVGIFCDEVRFSICFQNISEGLLFWYINPLFETNGIMLMSYWRLILFYLNRFQNLVSCSMLYLDIWFKMDTV